MKRLLLYCILLTPVSFALTIANYTPETNDRFANDTDFVGDAFDFSGVARVQNPTNTNQYRWATLIGDNYFISADHFNPPVGSDVTFYATNDAAGPSFTYNVTGGAPIAGTDLWLGYFSNEVDSSIARYDFNTLDADTISDTGIDGVIYQYAQGGSVSYAGAQLTATAVAQNRLEGFYNEGTNIGETIVGNFGFVDTGGNPVNAAFDQLILVENEAGDTDNPAEFHEGQAVNNDSGSPLFSVENGELQLEGVAYAVGSLTGNFEGPNETRDASFYSYVGSYSDDINSLVSTFPAPVPEPSSLALLSLGGLTLLRRKR